MKNNNETKKKIVSNVSSTPLNDEEIGQDDFKFVQKDKAIHDVKFQTKPTTFMRDALSRFVKNKSSVVAGVILSVLTLMAILVPVFDTSNISEAHNYEKFLPPRWPGFSDTSIFNGKQKISGVIVDYVTDPDHPTPAGYEYEAVSDMKTYTAYISKASIYGTGGNIAIRSDKRDVNGGAATPQFLYNTDTNYQFTFNFNEESANAAIVPSYAIYALVNYDGGLASSDTSSKLLLKDFSSDFGSVTVSNLSEQIIAALPEGKTGTFFPVRLIIYFHTTPSPEDYPVVYLNSLSGTSALFPSDTSFANAGFTDANNALLVDADSGIHATTPQQWIIPNGLSGSVGLYQGVATYANFVYDMYEAAYNVSPDFVIGESNVQTYIDNGWMEYDFNVGPSSFVRLSDKCPIMSVTSQTSSSFGGITKINLTVDMSIYRYLGYSKIPNFIFGTDNSGHDYFKRVFAGLRTSLMLGVLATLINVTIGIIWGAISAYYGGWTDLVMERLTDILGGVPWIVVMTICILHFGNTAWVFLLAITLTGWIGTASVTRSQFYRYKRREYVLASRTLGAKDGRLIFRHILPNAVGMIVTSSVLMIPSIIFSEATIAYLNLGLQGVPSLGVALSEAQAYLDTSGYLIVSGSIIVSILMICFNLFGNGLRDAFNPSLKGVE